MEFLSRNTDKEELQGKVRCLVRDGRELSRLKGDRDFSDSPDTKDESDWSMKTAIDIPMLMLFRKDGEKARGWMDSPFWWPVMRAPQETRVVIYASELVDIY